MRSIDGHFTIINQPGNAMKIASDLLAMFESMRSPEHVIISKETIEKASQNANRVLLEMLDTYIAIVDEKFAKLENDTNVAMDPNIKKAQDRVVETTRLAERNSTDRNWRKLDSAKKNLAKELDKAGFGSFTKYCDSFNVQGSQATTRKILIEQRENYMAQKTQCLKNDNKTFELTPAQVITVMAEILSSRPKSDIGYLPIVLDDALRDLNSDTKFRALDLLKSYSNEYAIWYVTDDPLVLGWSGFVESDISHDPKILKSFYDFELDVA